MFSEVPSYSGDSILSLMEEFKADPRPAKVNLSIGIYYDDQGNIPLPSALRLAREKILSADEGAQSYLPMAGMAPFNSGTQKLLFGVDSEALKQGRIVTVQTIGGSGALKVGADFLYRAFPRSKVWVSNPTWDNHIGIFEGAGFEVGSYPYFDPSTGGVDFTAMHEKLASLAPASIVLLHPCCHNPTGADLDNAQWDEVVRLIQTRELIPFLDIAYQGFGAGFDEDAYLIRALETAGCSFLVSNSFSKICSVYGDRVGALSVVCATGEEAERVGGQLQGTVRRNYSSPPAFGARLVSTVLNDEALRSQWKSEVDAMRQRILDMRSALHAALTRETKHQDFGYLLTQRGMFSYTGLSASQVQTLRDQFGIYLVRSGRLCISGLRTSNIDTVASAIAQVLKAGQMQAEAA